MALPARKIQGGLTVTVPVAEIRTVSQQLHEQHHTSAVQHRELSSGTVDLDWDAFDVSL